MTHCADKGKSLIEPISTQSIQGGFTGLLYDFKFPTLAQVAQQALLQQPATKGYYVNFADLSRSHRLNPVYPSLMKTPAHADEYAQAILYNLNPDSIKKADFWTDSAQSYLTAVLGDLREEHPGLFTPPHAIALLFEPVACVVARLSQQGGNHAPIGQLW